MTETPAPANSHTTEGGLIMQCQRCGKDMPPLPDDLARLARSHGGVSLAHDVCPGDAAASQPGRVFEVRVQIVEVSQPVDVDPDPDAAGDDFEPIIDELVRFRHEVRAENLDAAMRPLATGLGEKWMAAEKQAKVADGGGS